MESGSSNDEDLIAWWVYGAVALLSVVLLLGGHLVQADYPATAIFLKELAFAGVIALILIGTIERFSRRRHERAVNTLVERIKMDLFHAIYERYIPHVVFNEVEKALLRSNVFREDHEVYYTLEPLEDDGTGVCPPCGKYVKCIARASYRLKNITGNQITHTVKLNLERPTEANLINRCRITMVEIDRRSLTVKEIEGSTRITPIQISFGYDVVIKPGEAIFVNTTAELIKQNLDQEIWTSMVPSDGIKLTVTVPAKDLEVKAHALHVEEVETFLDDDINKVWRLRYGMFPFQSVVFWWHPRQENGCPMRTNSVVASLT